jgi:phosphate transport system permease protein
MTAGVIPTRTPRPSARQRAVTERTRRSLGRRRLVNGIMLGVLALAAVITVLPLVFILFHLLAKGATSLDLAFFTHMPKPVGEAGGGMANAIVGTLIVIGLAMACGLPVGVGAGLYLAEHRGEWLANSVRFLSDVLNGLPSIVMGIFAWQFLVRPIGHFSALSGGVALGAMMIPMIARTTEEMVRTVPTSLREAALALGYARWRTGLTIVLRTASAGIVTGVLVSLARAAGETAPLLFTDYAADRRAAPPNLQLCHQSLRRLAPARMGGCPGPHLAHPRHQRHRPLRHPGTLRHWKRRLR